MNFKQTLEKIQNSTVFKNFKNKHSDAVFCAGFFILDFIGNDNKKTLDYKIGERIFTFTLNDGDEITMLEDKLIKSNKHPGLEKLEPEVKIELDELKSIAGTRALDEGISGKFHKIIAVLQKLKDKPVWNLTCLLEHLIILNVIIDSNNGEILKFERKSMMDLIRKK
jgi:hypothetical protein